MHGNEYVAQKVSWDNFFAQKYFMEKWALYGVATLAAHGRGRGSFV